MNRKTALIASLLFAAAVTFRLLAWINYPEFTSTEFEGYSRLTLARIFDETPRPNYPAIHFGPLGTVYLWLVREATGSAVFGPRVVNLVASLAGLLFLFATARRLFGDRAALFALAAASGDAMHVLISIETVSEGLHATVFLAGLAAFVSLHRTKQHGRGTLALTAALLAAASAVRFETWPLLIVFPAALLFQKRGREAIVLAAALTAFPLFHMAMNYFAAGDPLAFLRTAAKTALENSPTLSAGGQLAVMLDQLRWSATSVGVGLGAIGLIVVFFTKKTRWFGMVALLLAAELIVQVARGALYPGHWRYFTLLSLLLCMTGGALLDKAAAAWPFQRIRDDAALAVIVLTGFVIGVVSMTRFTDDYTELLSIEAQHRMLDRLEARLDPNDSVLVGPAIHSYFAAVTKLPVKRVFVPGAPPVGAPSPLGAKEIIRRFSPDAIMVDLTDPLFENQIPLFGRRGRVKLEGSVYEPVVRSGPYVLWEKVEKTP